MSRDQQPRWMARLPQYCVTLVEHADPDPVLAGFGAPDGPVAVGGSREATGLMTEESGFRPVVRVVPADDWAVAVEEYSLEGVRPEVLRRLSVGGRAAAVGASGDGMAWLGYAVDGHATRVETTAASAPGDRDWDALVEMAARASVSLDAWDAGDLPGSARRFVASVCEFELDDDIIFSPGHVGIVLPVLPDVASARTRVDAMLENVPAASVKAVAERHLREFLADVGVNEGVLDGPGDDEAPNGLVLRELIAGALLGARPGMSPERAAALRQRADAGHVAHALLAAGPRAAIVAMLQRRQSPPGWRQRLLADLGIADDRTSRRARSLPVDTGQLRPMSPRRQAVPHPETRPDA